MNARRLSMQEMDAVDALARPVLTLSRLTPSGAITLAIHATESERVVSSQPFEALGPYEAYPTLDAALRRSREVLDALALDLLPSTALAVA